MFHLLQVSNEQLLLWKDKTKNPNNTFEPSDSKCDLKDNILKKDAGKIMDKTKLPLLGISYGKFNYGMAKFKVGPLVCSQGKSHSTTVKTQTKVS